MAGRCNGSDTGSLDAGSLDAAVGIFRVGAGLESRAVPVSDRRRDECSGECRRGADSLMQAPKETGCSKGRIAAALLYNRSRCGDHIFVRARLARDINRPIT